MNWTRFAMACVALYVFYHLFGWIFHEYLMMDTYAALTGVAFRTEAEMMSRMWVMFLTSVVWVVLFCYIFVRGYEGKGLMEGVRYGVIISLFMGLPYAYESWVLYPLPLSLAHQWFISGVIFSVLGGVIVAAIYRPKASPGM